MLKNLSEHFETSTSIAVSVIQRRALLETLFTKKRNKLSAQVIVRCNSYVSFFDGKPRTCDYPGKCPRHDLDPLRITNIKPSYNVRTAAGALWQAGIMGSGAGTPAGFIALSTAVLTPANGDTTLTSEILTGTNAGLARAAATYQSYVAPTVLGNAFAYQLYKLYTTSAAATINSAGQFTAASAGTLFVEANFATPATLGQANDQLATSWNING